MVKVMPLQLLQLNQWHLSYRKMMSCKWLLQLKPNCKHRLQNTCFLVVFLFILVTQLSKACILYVP